MVFTVMANVAVSLAVYTVLTVHWWFSQSRQMWQGEGAVQVIVGEEEEGDSRTSSRGNYGSRRRGREGTAERAVEVIMGMRWGREETAE